MDACPKYHYFFELIGICARSVKVCEGRSSFQLDSINYEGLSSDEKNIFLPERKFMIRILQQAKKKRPMVELAKAYCHFAFADKDLFQELVLTIQEGLNEYDYDDIKPFLVLLQLLLSK